MPTRAERATRFDLIDLELFSRIVEAGSITHGARRAHLALPSASARIRLMEKAVGTSLLRRGRRGVTATRAGELLLRHARTVLHQIDELRGDLAQYAEGLVATIRLLANTSATATSLPGDLIPFLAAHPDIDIDLEERPSHQIVRAVAEGGADIGIVASTVDPGRLECLPLRDDPLVLAIPVGHALRRRKRIAFAECLDRPFVGLAEGSALYEHLEGHALPLGQRPTYRIRVPTVEAVCQTVAAGVGVSVLPEAAVRRWRDTYPMATVALTDPWAARRLVLCVNPVTASPTPVRLLVEHLATRRDV
ncbi:LysR substrate-binding domain-containing protein [Rugosimonospora africana]|uniref:Transcriptional regulator n=1 Tax=Rugosimonospora africana TaxID=556532 RepID=A0A8J3R1K3_9ACTN|nr:LysR substrate-binding domain-containing protein [Rugosimonospora africana]GIH21300.1 transcriptional regulator [Rugosimonospora africana]